MLVSPCRKCGCTEDRRVCSGKCQLLAEYREALGNPFLGLHMSTLEFIDTGIFWTLPVSRGVVEEEDYYH